MPDSVWSGATVRTADWLSVFPLHPKIAAFFGTRGLASLTSLQFLRATKQLDERKNRRNLASRKTVVPPAPREPGFGSEILPTTKSVGPRPESEIFNSARRLAAAQRGIPGYPPRIPAAGNPPSRGGKPGETRVSPPARPGNPRKPPPSRGETRGTRDSPRTARETPETGFPGGDSGTPESGGGPAY